MSPRIRKGRRSAVAHAAGCVVESLEARQLLYTPVPVEFAIKVGEMSINSRTEPGATGYVKSLAVEAGRTYWLKATGPVTMGPSRYGDAEYFDTQTSTPGDYKLDRGDFGVRLMGDQGINGSSPYKWGPYESSHVYTMQITAPSNLLTAEFVDSNHADNSGSVKVEVFALPEVSVVAGDADASEDGQNSAVFTFARTGPTSRELTVYYALDGTAIPGTPDTDGNPYPEDADYTGPIPDIDHPGLFKITIPAGSSSKTLECITLNDAAVEGPETINLVLQADLAPAQSYSAPAANPPALAFMAAAIVKDVIVTEVPSDPGAPLANDLQTWINTYLDPQSNAAEKEGAKLALKAAFAQHQGSVEPLLDAKLDAATQANDAPTVALLQSVLGPIRVRVSFNNLKVSVRFQPAGVAHFGVAYPENDPLAHFFIPDDPRAKAAVVPPDGVIGVKPQVIVDRRTIFLEIVAADKDDNAVPQWNYTRPVMLAQVVWNGVI